MRVRCLVRREQAGEALRLYDIGDGQDDVGVWRCACGEHLEVVVEQARHKAGCVAAVGGELACEDAVKWPGEQNDSRC